MGLIHKIDQNTLFINYVIQWRHNNRRHMQWFLTDHSGSHIMSRTSEEKDLGIFITDNLKPSLQCTKAATRARSILWMVRRNFKRLDCDDFLIIYKTYIRPHLEYAIQAWSPYLQKDIQCLESVQRAATRLVSGFKKISYEERLRKVGLTTLEVRRQRRDLIECYKILTGKENIDPHQFFHLSDNLHGLRGHSFKLSFNRLRLDLRKNFFSQRVISAWNSLPQNVVDATSVNSFKNRLDAYWKTTGYGQ